MRNVYVVADNIFSPIGKNTADNIQAIKKGISGIQLQSPGISAEPFYASLFNQDDKKEDKSKTFFEQIVYASAREAIQQTNVDPKDSKTGFILSSTKGNISLIENLPDNAFPHKRIALNTSADLVATALGFTTQPLVVSHACISGLLAMITGMRLIQSGVYDHLVITGFRVTPVVGFVNPEYQLKIAKAEVHDAFEVPLDFILDAANHKFRQRTLAGHTIEVYDIPYGERNIWGATAGMLMTFRRMLQEHRAAAR